MIQFNLLPDVKIEYIKTRYRKRLLMFISAVVTAVFLAIFIILFLFVRVNQKLHLKSLDKDIQTQTTEIKKTNDLDKILTIQNQINSLPDLHNKKVVASRLIDYLNKVTPNQATISNVTIDFEASTLSIKGNAPNLVIVNQYTDSLKYTDYKVNGTATLTGTKDETGKAFNSVVLDAFALPSSQASAGSGNLASYSISMQFMPAIFSQVSDDTTNGVEPVTLTVPTITSTSSITEKPLFKQAPAVTPTTGGGR